MPSAVSPTIFDTLASASAVALEALRDEPARLVAGLARELLATAAEALGEACPGRARSSIVRLRRPSSGVGDRSVGDRAAVPAVAGSIDLVGAVGQIGVLVVGHGDFSFADFNPGPSPSFRGRSESCTPGRRAYRRFAHADIITPPQERTP